MSDLPHADEPLAVHRPVLLQQVLQYMDLQPGHVVLDGTVGAGGHSRAMIERIMPGGRLIGLDRDPMMLALAAQTLRGFDCDLIHASYADSSTVLDGLGVEVVDRSLVDLGLSSNQLADTERGFRFDSPGGLDMRFDTSRGRSAEELVNTLSVDELFRVIRDFGEERFAGRIARNIVARRPIQTSEQLADLVCRSLPKGRAWQRLHPATRTFQALRIAVNDELGAIEHLVTSAWPKCIRPGGIAVAISFHSLEDRIVKRAFKSRDVWANLTKKPVTADEAERRENPRARSAKLRAAARRSDDPSRN